jgi:transcriptional regulator with XRE-family HTH domain
MMRPVADPRAARAHSVDVHVGARVRQRRKALGMNQMTLAQQLGLTFQQVQKYERGSNRISASKLFEIGTALQVPISFFFDGYKSDTPASRATGPDGEVHEFLHTSEAIDLGTAFLAIGSTEQRRRMLDLMKAMGA